MRAVSISMMNAIRESLLGVDLDFSELIPLKQIDRHYCSLQMIEPDPRYLCLFTVVVDDKTVFVYFKI